MLGNAAHSTLKVCSQKSPLATLPPRGHSPALQEEEAPPVSSCLEGASQVHTSRCIAGRVLARPLKQWAPFTGQPPLLQDLSQQGWFGRGCSKCPPHSPGQGLLKPRASLDKAKREGAELAGRGEQQHITAHRRGAFLRFRGIFNPDRKTPCCEGRKCHNCPV